MAEAKPQKKDLPAADRARLERILDSDPGALSDADHNFIMARRDYLTSDEAKRMGVNAKAIKEWSERNASEGEDDDDEDDE